MRLSAELPIFRAGDIVCDRAGLKTFEVMGRYPIDDQGYELASPDLLNDVLADQSVSAFRLFLSPIEFCPNGGESVIDAVLKKFATWSPTYIFSPVVQAQTVRNLAQSALETQRVEGEIEPGGLLTVEFLAKFPLCSDVDDEKQQVDIDAAAIRRYAINALHTRKGSTT